MTDEISNKRIYLIFFVIYYPVIKTVGLHVIHDLSQWRTMDELIRG